MEQAEEEDKTMREKIALKSQKYVDFGNLWNSEECVYYKRT